MKMKVMACSMGTKGLDEVTKMLIGILNVAIEEHMMVGVIY